MAVTWLPPMAMLLWWMIRLNREKRAAGRSIMAHKWYTNIWFVLLGIAVWAVMIDIIMLRLLNGR
jgi:hypothetical protein